jgi:predicted dehydrogenase
LAGLAPAPKSVRLHSRHNAAGLQQWIAQKGLSAHIDVVEDWPDFGAFRPDAIIVANRAADHAAAVGSALDAGVAVLVEKPMAIGAETVRQLQRRAVASGSLLAASHVFLFARYFEAFAAELARHGQVHRLEMIWQDGRDDVVRGEMKLYDPALPVFDDVLPHVLPMLAHLAQRDLSVDSLAMDRGGAAVTIEATAQSMPIGIHLARNADRRRRLLTAHTADGPCAMDFSTEPGMLSVRGAIQQNGDPLWDTGALRPLGAMLTTFLQAVRDGRLDARLSPGKALASALFADDVRDRYLVRRKAWIHSRGNAPADEALAYALREISAQI